MRYEELFYALHPAFFEREDIRSLEEDGTFTELVMELRERGPEAPPFPCPEGLVFSEYCGPLSFLQRAVAQVEDGWVRYFGAEGRYFCALDGEQVVSFCVLDDMGCHRGLKVGGPGCVGTVPAYRGRGIGLTLVQKATEILRLEGFDLAWIHWTHLPSWYQKLGYRPVLFWNRRGFIREAVAGQEEAQSKDPAGGRAEERNPS